MRNEDVFMDIVSKANNKELYEMKELLEKEIRLSETAIKEGFESDEIEKKSKSQKQNKKEQK